MQLKRWRLRIEGKSEKGWKSKEFDHKKMCLNLINKSISVFL